MAKKKARKKTKKKLKKKVKRGTARRKTAKKKPVRKKPRKKAKKKAKRSAAKKKVAKKTPAKKKARKSAKKKLKKKAKRAAARKKIAKRRPVKKKATKKKVAKRRPVKKRATKKKAAPKNEGASWMRPIEGEPAFEEMEGAALPDLDVGTEPAAAILHVPQEAEAEPAVVTPPVSEPAEPQPGIEPEPEPDVLEAPTTTPRPATVPEAAPVVRAARLPSPFSVDARADGEAFVNCIRRRGTPSRVHHVELFLDGEIQDEICRRYGIVDDLDPADEFFPLRRQIAIQRFLGYDYVVAGPEGCGMQLNNLVAEDTAGLAREGGRSFIDEHRGPITTMEEYERYPWPDPEKMTTRALEWYERNLPDDMCVIGGLCGHFAENLSWLMGYETLCRALYEDRDLVSAIARRTLLIDREVVKRLCQFDRVKAIWGSDDMGHRTGTLISPDDLREFVLPGHRILASFAHMHGRPYLLHSCGNLAEIMDDLIHNVRIDAKHSFEDTIEDVRDAKRKYGESIALLGGIDVDFLCRADEDAVRMRVRSTLSTCMAGGGYCLGTGNSVANYIPVDNYLAMIDEGRKFGR